MLIILLKCAKGTCSLRAQANQAQKEQHTCDEAHCGEQGSTEPVDNLFSLQ